MKLLKKRFKSMALFGALLCAATTVVPTVAAQAARPSKISTAVGTLQIRGSVTMDRDIYRPLPGEETAKVVNECNGAVEVDLDYKGVPGVLHLAAHRTTCRDKGTGFGGIEDLRAGDTMTITLDGVTTRYEWVSEEIFDRFEADGKTGRALTVPPLGDQVVLQTSWHDSLVYLEWFRPILKAPANNGGKKISQGRPACVEVGGAQKGSWVFANVTPVAGEGSGFVTVYPFGRNDIVPNPRNAPTTSTANWTSAVASPNTTLVQAGDGGKICVAAYGGAVHVILDALAIASNKKFIAPQTKSRRLIDTRSSGGVVTNRSQCFNLPDETKGKWTVLNLTAIGRSTGWGRLEVRGNRSTYSNVNFRNGDVDSNMVIIKVPDVKAPARAELCYYGNGSSHALVDFIATASTNTFKNVSGVPGRPMPTIAASSRVQAFNASKIGVGANEWAFINATPLPRGNGVATFYDCRKYPGAGSDVNYSNRADPNVAIVKATTSSKPGEVPRLCIARTGALAGWVIDTVAVAGANTFTVPSLRRIYDSREKS